ncbi:MAG: hypothetical protein Q4A32_05690 [Lachnospiraceae bacterium]|nr:hypothetical protein [Lachnospiraceae bacterium]
MRRLIYKQAGISYCVFNPTGNITILVETPVPVSRQPSIASRLMELEPEAEQVGFLSYPTSDDLLPEMASELEGQSVFLGQSDSSETRHFRLGRTLENQTACLGQLNSSEIRSCRSERKLLCTDGNSGATSCDIALRMAGGEFCGNATMCAAVYAAMMADVTSAEVVLSVSGAVRPVRAKVDRLADGSWEGTVEMPKPERVEEVELPGAGILPVVSFDGISHVILDRMFERERAEEYARLWCGFLGADAVGLMFLDEASSSLLPLVYVPAANTLCWENSCASGTTAVGAHLASREGLPFTIALRQPGGSLTVSATLDGALTITGIVK